MNDDQFNDIAKKVTQELEKEWDEYFKRHEKASKQALESIKLDRMTQSKGNDLLMPISEIKADDPKDQHIADQMCKLHNHYIKKRKKGNG